MRQTAAPGAARSPNFHVPRRKSGAISGFPPLYPSKTWKSGNRALFSGRNGGKTEIGAVFREATADGAPTNLPRGRRIGGSYGTAATTRKSRPAPWPQPHTQSAAQKPTLASITAPRPTVIYSTTSKGFTSSSFPTCGACHPRRGRAPLGASASWCRRW